MTAAAKPEEFQYRAGALTREGVNRVGGWPRTLAARRQPHADGLALRRAAHTRGTASVPGHPVGRTLADHAAKEDAASVRCRARTRAHERSTKDAPQKKQTPAEREFFVAVLVGFEPICKPLSDLR